MVSHYAIITKHPRLEIKLREYQSSEYEKDKRGQEVLVEDLDVTGLNRF